MVEGEHYIRGLSDNELEKFVGLNRNMYTKAELKIADDEMAKRKRARAMKAEAPTPAAAPRRSDDAGAPAAGKPGPGSAGETNPPAVSRAPAGEDAKRSPESVGPAKAAGPSRAVERRDMPAEEGSAKPEAPQETGGAFMYCTNCGKKLSLYAQVCPNCGNRVALDDEPEPYPPLLPAAGYRGPVRRARPSDSCADTDGCPGGGSGSCFDRGI